jgi:hypothetical protein
MNYFLKRFFLVVILATVASQIKAGEPVDGLGKNDNDSISNLKSNIVIFRMISSLPVTNTNSAGSLKKAGKVARTSSTPLKAKTHVEG